MAESAEALQARIEALQRELAEAQAQLNAEGERNVTSGGDIAASTVVTGDENVLTDGGASVTGEVDVERGDFVGRDKTVGGDEVQGPKVEIRGETVVITSDALAAEVAAMLTPALRSNALDDEQLEQITQRYLVFLLNRFRYLEFRGMGMADRVALQLPLTEMYVPLRARMEAPRGETWARELMVAGRKASEEEAAAIGERLSEPQPLPELLGRHDGLIILGDPGAGKTTFLKYLTLRLAAGEGEALGLGPRLPILAPLSAYANALAEQSTVAFQDFLGDYYRAQNVPLQVGALLEAALNQGRALVMLDGLDEVQKVEDRTLVLDRVAAFFAFHRQAGNKFLLTSRIVGYRDVRFVVDGLRECTLVDFDDGEIEEFVGKWTSALERAAHDDDEHAAQVAARERSELLAAMQRNPGVRRLASNPLLLTILALMKRQGVTLPDRRVELYENYVQTLLRHWNLARGLGGRSGRELDVLETLRVLAPLALWMHRTSPGIGLVKREEMGRELERIYGEREAADPEAAARRLLTDVRQHASLLLERGPGQYGFIHLTFQEYLAAVAIAQLGQSDVGPVVELLAAHVNDDTWREVALLTIGYMGLIQQRDKAAGETLERLIGSGAGEPGAAAVLAGEAVLDAWPGGVTVRCQNLVRERLLARMVDDTNVAPAMRARAGSVLGALGDPRPGVSVVDDTPDIEWLHVMGGYFTMGDSESSHMDEKPAHKVLVNDIRISKYPITNEQYSAFVRATKYETPSHWIAGRPPALLLNHPVTGVRWSDALAFCEWLSKKTEQDVRLPSEAEWEKAAKGDKGQRRYPWGNESPDANRCNFARNIGTTTPVGIYPQGESPCKCLDMSGNVFEWTRNLWFRHDDEAFRYPYQSDDGREAVANTGLRVVRGGAFDDNAQYVRCAFRDDGYLDYRLDNVGFRVVSAGPW